MDTPVLPQILKHLDEITLVTKEYCQQADGFEIASADIKDWLTNVPEPMRSSMASKAPDNVVRSFLFLRYFLQLRDLGMNEYMHQHLRGDALRYWQPQKQDSGASKPEAPLRPNP